MKPRVTFLVLIPLLAAFLAVPRAHGQIYRCETAQGIVFSDSPCSDEAEVVELEEDTAGISGGPPEHVRTYLAEKRDERAEDREARQERRIRDAQRQARQPVTLQREVIVPGYWPGYPRPRPPINRPRPPDRPTRPPPDTGSPGNVMRPRDN